MFNNVTKICFLSKRVIYLITQEPEGKTKIGSPQRPSSCKNR